LPTDARHACICAAIESSFINLLQVQYVKFPVDCVSTQRRRPHQPGYLHPRYVRREAIEERRESLVNGGANLLEQLTIVDQLEENLQEDYNGSEDNDDAEDDGEGQSCLTMAVPAL